MLDLVQWDGSALLRVMSTGYLETWSALWWGWNYHKAHSLPVWWLMLAGDQDLASVQSHPEHLHVVCPWGHLASCRWWLVPRVSIPEWQGWSAWCFHGHIVSFLPYSIGWDSHKVSPRLKGRAWKLRHYHSRRISSISYCKNDMWNAAYFAGHRWKIQSATEAWEVPSFYRVVCPHSLKNTYILIPIIPLRYHPKGIMIKTLTYLCIKILVTTLLTMGTLRNPLENK